MRILNSDDEDNSHHVPLRQTKRSKCFGQCRTVSSCIFFHKTCREPLILLSQEDKDEPLETNSSVGRFLSNQLGKKDGTYTSLQGLQSSRSIHDYVIG